MSLTPNNRAPANPSLADLLDAHGKDLLLFLNCHAIATVQSFDATKQLVTATMNYKKTVMRKSRNKAASTSLPSQDPYVLEDVDYPILVDCPAIVLGGGTGALTMPIQAGDECLILFNDRDIDNWFAGGPIRAVNTPRLHSFSDGVALVGLYNSQRVIPNYDTTRVVLRKGNAKVGVGDAKLLLANNITTLNTLLQQLVTAIQGIQVTVAGPGTYPITPANIAALTAVANNIQGLLE